MVSEKQLEANRRNARKSTGPRTEEGKSVSRTNARKHGLLARSPALPHVERQEDWTQHREAVLASLQPVGYFESLLAERIAQLTWRMGRVVRFEKDKTKTLLDDPENQRKLDESKAKLSAMEALVNGTDSDVVDASVAMLIIGRSESIADGYFKRESLPILWTNGLVRHHLTMLAEHGKTSLEHLIVRLSDEFRRAYDEQASDRQRSRRVKHLLPAHDLVKITRYEAHLERSVFRNLHELQRLQAARKGASVPPPAMLDVTITGAGEDV